MKPANVIALGFFDGIHLGHGALLQTARRRADELGCSACLLTFDLHPDTLVFGTPVPLINTMADRQAIAKECYAMDQVLVLHFDRETMQMPWEEFVQRILVQEYHAVHVVCGHDFRFGYRGQGTAARLQEKCNQLGIGCDIIGQISLDGIPVSSTYIRQLLQAGDLAQANRFLGHPHRLSGIVCSGRHLGRTLGIPTANIPVPPEVLPPKFGVYATQVWFDRQAHPAVTNVGTRPTVGGKHVTVEPWILNYQGDLYGHEIRVDFHARLRDEQKFPSLDALKEEIHRNAQQTLAYFEESQ